MSTKPVKGTRDFLPDDIFRRAHVTDVIRSVYASHGFLPLETPTLERLDTLTGKYGEEGDQLLFKILKRGQPLVAGIQSAAAHIAEPGGLVEGRSGQTAPGAEPLLADLGLRYDLTVPLARMYANSKAKLPPIFRRYQIQPVWRADNPGKGRFREFYQCDVDLIGTESLLAEVEVCGAVAECLRRLGFDRFRIRINHRRLLGAFVQSCGVGADLAGEAITAIDKLDKIGPDGVQAELAQRGIDAGAAGKILAGLAEGSLSSLKAVDAEAVADLERVLSLAAETPAAEHLAFDLTLARGLGYYTGCIFEIAVEDLAGSLGGGGRYDGLVGMFLGKAVPAVGFSIGLERILVVMEQRNMFPAAIGRGPQVVVAALDADQLDRTVAVAQRLRAAGLRVELSMQKEKAGKLRKRADERGVAHAVMLRNDGINLWARAEPDVRDRMVSEEELLASVTQD